MALFMATIAAKTQQNTILVMFFAIELESEKATEQKQKIGRSKTQPVQIRFVTW